MRGDSFIMIVLPRSGNLVPGRHMRWHHPLQRLGLGWFIIPCKMFTIHDSNVDSLYLQDI